MSTRIDDSKGAFGAAILLVFACIVGCEGTSPPNNAPISNKQQARKAAQANATNNQSQPPPSLGGGAISRGDQTPATQAKSEPVQAAPANDGTPSRMQAALARVAQASESKTSRPKPHASDPPDVVSLQVDSQRKVSKILLSANDAWLAAVDLKGWVQLYDPQSAQPLASWNVGKNIVDIAFSFDRSYLYALTDEPLLHVWDLNNAREVDSRAIVSAGETVKPTCMSVLPTSIVIGTETDIRELQAPRFARKKMQGTEGHRSSLAASSRRGLICAVSLDGGGKKIAFLRQNQRLLSTVQGTPTAVATSDAGRAYIGFLGKKLRIISFDLQQSPLQTTKARIGHGEVDVPVEPEILELVDNGDSIAVVERNGKAAVVDSFREVSEEFTIPVASKIEDVEVTNYGGHWFVLEDNGELKRLTYGRMYEHERVSQVTDQHVSWFYSGRFDDLEASFVRLRKQPGKSVNGGFQLQSITDALADLRNVNNGGFELHDQWLKAWKARPLEKRLGLGVVMARHLVHLAWKSRGSGVASTVSQTGFARFHQGLELAAQALDEVEPHIPNDVELMRTRITIAKGLNSRRIGVVDKYAAKILDVAPDYEPFHTDLAAYLLPRWHGQPGDVQAYAKRVADRLGGSEGDQMYAAIFATTSKYFNSVNAMFDLGFDYDRVQKGLKELAASDPWNELTYTSLRGLLTFVMQDRENAKDAIKTLKPLTNRLQWKALLNRHWPLRRYDHWSRWANEEQNAATTKPTLAWLPHMAIPGFAIAFRDDNTLLTFGAGGQGCDLRRWDPKTGALLEKLFSGPRMRETKIGPQGEWIISKPGAPGRVNNVGINLRASKQLTFPNSFRATNCEVTRDGRYVLNTSNFDGLVTATPLQNGIKPLELSCGKKIYSAIPNADSTIAFVDAATECIVMDLATGAKLGEFPEAGRPWMESGSDTALVAVANDAIYEWNPRTGEKKVVTKRTLNSPPDFLAGNRILWVSKDRSRVLLANSIRQARRSDTNIPGLSLYDLETTQEISRIAVADALSVVVSPNGKWIAAPDRLQMALQLWAVDHATSAP